jgi:UDP-N-acetylmuramate dehydrogenase
MPIQENISLQPYHSFACEEFTNFFTIIQNEASLTQAIQWAKTNKQPFLAVGAGTHLLFTKTFKGLVLKIALTGIQKLKESSSEIILSVGAGENWSHLVSYCVQKSWGGLENLSFIPGTVGAAPILNISAYGVTVSEHIISVTAYDTVDQKLIDIPNLDCAFGYKESLFLHEAGRYIVCSVKFKLSKQPLLRTDYGAIKAVLHDRGIKNPSVESISNAILYLRSIKFPDSKKINNAGFFFKKPMITKAVFHQLIHLFPNMMAYPIHDETYKIDVDWLITACGWNDMQKNGVGCYKDCPQILVNHHATKGKTIYDFSEEIIISVKEKFGIILERAVNIL